MKDAAAAPYDPAPLELAARGPSIVEPALRTEIDADDGVTLLGATVPAWQRDIVAVSARVRALLVTMRPMVVRVVTFWDHAVRSVTIGRRRLEIDPSGSYRVR